MKKLALILMTLTVLASCKKTEGQPAPPPQRVLIINMLLHFSKLVPDKKSLNLQILFAE